MSPLLPGKRFYFCFGSNLWTKRMHINVKSAEKYANGLLKDWKLAFSGHSTRWNGATANIVPQPNDRVWGVIWTMDDKELEPLDRQEVGYRRIEIEVSVNGTEEKVKCLTYVQKEHETDPRFTQDETKNLPSLTYKSVILKGATEHQLPADYMLFLDGLSHNGLVEIDRKDGVQSICHSDLFCDNKV